MQNTTCERCHASTTSNQMGVIQGMFYSRLCHNCINQPFNVASREYDKDRQREKYSADVLQPFVDGKPNRDFIRAYPDRVGDYFTKDDLKNMQ